MPFVMQCLIKDSPGVVHCPKCDWSAQRLDPLGCRFGSTAVGSLITAVVFVGIDVGSVITETGRIGIEFCSVDICI